MFNKYRAIYLSNRDFYNRRLVLISGSVILVFFMLYAVFLSAPRLYPAGSIYNLKYGQTLSGVSEDFSANKIIRYQFIFKSFVYLFSFGKAKILEGEYALYKKQSTATLAWRVTHGSYEIVPLQITIPEGLNSFEISDILDKKLPLFNTEAFLNLVKKDKLEGYLFPDTYFFLPNIKERGVVEIMNNNFNIKIKEVEPLIKTFGKPISDVIKMASILEEEARLYESRQIIAGILWKRISIGMALQVDASFKYINGKTTKTLSLEDLKIDSPYNSYLYRGLPPTPISNPGLEAIKAAVNPIKTDYLYFLTDNNGNMHYAETFDEHVANKFKYLR